MVMQVKTQLGATRLVNTNYLAWKKKAAVERRWAPAKKYFRATISDVVDLNKLTTSKASLIANAAVSNKSTEQQVRKEMEEKLRESFNTLEMAATAKYNTIKSLIKTISKLTSNNSELTATIKKLTSQLERDLSKNG